MSETTVNLTKGERVDLTKTNPGLKVAHVGMGWDVNQGNGPAFDLDVFALVLKTGSKLLGGGDDIIYFNHKTGSGIEHMGDNLTGVGDGDDETMKIKLANVPAAAEEILLCVNIYQATDRKQNFGMVNNAFIRIYDGETTTEILKFDLTENYSAFTGMVMGKLYRNSGEWKFQAIGEGKNGSITDIANPYK